MKLDLSQLPSLEAIDRELSRRAIIDRIRNECAEAFKPLDKPARYKGVHGGRGSGKSHRFAEKVVLWCMENPGARIVGIREIQKSIRLSVRQLIVDKIKMFGAEDFFEIQEAQIKTPGDGLIIFQGMQNHTSDSIKSLEGFDVAWIEEAQSLSQRSLTLLRPTMRKPGSEIWASWNPDQPDDAIDDFFRGAKPPEGSIVIEANYYDNPHFPDVLREEMEYDKRRDPDKYKHVWLGGYQSRSEARVFHNWRVEDFETPADARFLFGADWGFSNDPTTLVRGFVGRFEDGKAIADDKGRCLFIDHEAYKIGCAIDKTPDLFCQVPGADRWPIRADSARPETIDYMQRNGFPRMVRSTKGKGSIVDGVEFIKSYDVIIHSRCKHTEDEFIHYSYKIDPKTDEVLPVLADDDNHIIDPIRYMLELVRKAKRDSASSIFAPKILG
jgi:phage terminase large subunit